MADLPLGSATRLLFTGAPKLYRAARDAGAGRRTALTIVAESAYVLVRSARHSPGRWRLQNAVRHFTWQAWLTARHGFVTSRAVAAAQERGRERTADSLVDQRNNAVGQTYGHAHADELVALGRRRAVSHLLDVGTAQFQAGALAAEDKKR
jgi:hypothetical protein